MQIDEIGLDIFKEIGNIGSGNAVTALASLLNCSINMTIPRCGMVAFREVADIIGGPEAAVAAVLVKLSGDLDGYIMLVQKLSDAQELMQVLIGSNITADVLKDYEEVKRSLQPLEEVGNILIGSYLTAISDMTQMRIIPSVPMLCIDMASAVMDVPATVYGEVGESVLLLETEFIGISSRINGHYFLIPSVDSYDKLLKVFYG